MFLLRPCAEMKLGAAAHELTSKVSLLASQFSIWKTRTPGRLSSIYKRINAVRLWHPHT
jgi:hypothetical protein